MKQRNRQTYASTRRPLTVCERQLLLVAIVILSLVAATSHAETNIGFLADGPWSRNTELRGAYEREIAYLAGDEFDVVFSPNHYVMGNWNRASIESALQELLANSDVDIVITTGLIGSQLAGEIERLPKPVIASMVVDPELQGLPLAAGGVSGRRNLNYLTIPATVERDLIEFKRITQFANLTFLHSAPYLSVVPQRSDRPRTVGRKTRHLD